MALARVRFFQSFQMIWDFTRFCLHEEAIPGRVVYRIYKISQDYHVNLSHAVVCLSLSDTGFQDQSFITRAASDLLAVEVLEQGDGVFA